MQAITQLALYKIIAMLVLWQLGSIIFLCYQLWTHPGDLQNAFMVFTSTLAGFLIYLEILVRLRK